jgi:glycosyltransferase involved in cell wall biosynthesis
VKVGFFSPLPPAPTGVADYSAQLLKALQPLGQVVVNDRNADVRLYHLGNNGLHGEIYKAALAQPGVIVLHDAVLHHFFLGSLGEPEYIAEFVYNYGTWNEELARNLWRCRARSAAGVQYFRYPMLKRVVERSLAVIVHNQLAAKLVAAHVPEARLHEIPHLFEPPACFPAEHEILRLRRELNLGLRTCLFGVFGHLRESKRLATVLRAFARAREASDMTLLVAGDFVSTDLERSLDGLLGPEQGILRVGFTAERDFWRYAAACDACINLRHPTAGETSGIAIRMLGIGKPVILSAGEDTAHFPPSSCLRVDRDLTEEDMLVDYMVWLARHPSDAKAIGQRAASHIAEFHNPARVAALYWQALLDCYH